MQTFHSWELAEQGPIAGKAGETVIAEFYNGSKTRAAELSISRLSRNGRESVATYAVDGKRAARALAANLNAKPWNF